MAGNNVCLGVTAAFATIVVALSGSTVEAPTRLTATALYMGGTDHPLSIPQDTPGYIDSYITWADDDFVGPSGLCVGGDPGCSPVAVYTPAQFWPVTGLSDIRFDESVAIGLANLADCVRGAVCTVTDPPYASTVSRPLTDTSYTVFGYSQSGVIASIIKSDLIAHPPAPGTVSFVFVSNPNRPHGGVLERFVGVELPLLGVTFNGATVTNSPQPTPLLTVDAAHQYDPVSDFPLNPLNLIADLNAALGFFYEHPEGQGGAPLLQGQYQDTTYYLIPAATIPLLRPLAAVPGIGPLLATVLDPPLRVLVETGYDRTINPGAPTPAKYLYFPNPITAAVNFLAAIPTGWDNGVAYLTGDPANRPFHTTPPGPYGVGGPEVDTGAVDPYGPPTPVLTAPAPARAATTARPEQGVPGVPARAIDARRADRNQPAAAPARAEARSTVANRRAASSTGPLRSRSKSDQ